MSLSSVDLRDDFLERFIMASLMVTAQSPSTESVEPAYVAPPGAGIGPGATPEPSVDMNMPDAQAAQAMQTAIQAGGLDRPTEAQVNHAMSVLADKFHMNVDEHAHVEWLIASGLITVGEGEVVVDALGIPRRPRVESPTMLHSQFSPATSVSHILPELRLQLPPVPKLHSSGVALPAASLPALPPMPTARPPGITTGQRPPLADQLSPIEGQPPLSPPVTFNIHTPSPPYQADHHAGPAWFPQFAAPCGAC